MFDRYSKGKRNAAILRDFHYFMLVIWTISFPVAIVTGLFGVTDRRHGDRRR